MGRAYSTKGIVNGHLIVLAIAFVALFIQIYLKLAAGPWQTEQEGHGPFLLAAAVLIAYLQYYRNADRLRSARPRVVIGTSLVVVGVIIAAIGQSQDITMAAAGSQVIVLAGLLLAYFGIAGISTMIIPLLLVGAATPPPGYLVDAVTVHLKENISDAVVFLLYHMGFDIAQNGVIIQAGPYELLVKDACAGMNSIFALSALSIIYIYIRSEAPLWQKLALVVGSLPVAIIANFLRVLSLCLLTFGFGLDSEESFHDLTGILLFVVAGLLLYGLDLLLSGLGWGLSRRSTRRLAIKPS